MATLQEIQAALAAKAAKNPNNNSEGAPPRTGGDNAVFPFWNMKPGQQATTRWLPDGDQDNVFPWIERQMIELKFHGVVGSEADTTNEVKVKIPCPKMFHGIIPDYTRACRITAHIAPWWDKQRSDNPSPSHLRARKYSAQKTWLMQGFNVEAPFAEDNPPENPIRRYVIRKQIFDNVFKAYNGTEFEVAPHDYDRGTDFYLKCTLQGSWNNWSSSEFARRERSLSDAERAAIQEFGLFNLKDFIPAAPDQDTIDAQYAMFLDSLDEKPFDFASYGQYYKPFGVRSGGNDGGNAARAEQAVSNGGGSSAAVETASASAPAAADGGQTATSTEDLIARIRGTIKD